jgi:hypothetical protein
MAAEPDTGAITPTVTCPTKPPEASVLAAESAAAAAVVAGAEELPEDPHAVRDAAIASPSISDVSFFFIVFSSSFEHPEVFTVLSVREILIILRKILQSSILYYKNSLHPDLVKASLPLTISIISANEMLSSNNIFHNIIIFYCTLYKMKSDPT